MSTFEGLIEEIPGISVDRFNDANLLSSAYFLSHCHCDHMKGLNESFFLRLQAKNQYLYCSSLSKAILQGKFRLEDASLQFIKEVRPCSPIIVDYVCNDSNESITVNCIPSGHCPGSVMFIFEHGNISILYTGDFRISPNDFPKLKPLNIYNGKKTAPRKFDKIYLDTTFLNPDYSELPSRRASLVEICRVAKDWLLRNPKNCIVIECPANYGSEFLYIDLMERLKKRVHVKYWVYDIYSRIDELSRCITNDPESTPIHACMMKTSRDGLQCRRDVTCNNILTIVPSAYRWAGRDLTNKISEWDDKVDNRFYVCISMHASYNELKAFLKYFQPKDIFPCVDPPAFCKTSAVHILNEMRKTFIDKNVEEISVEKSYNFESLIGNSSKRPRIELRYFSDDSSD